MGGEGRGPLWWETALEAIELSDEQKAAVDAGLLELRAVRERALPVIEALENELPRGKNLTEALHASEEAETLLLDTVDKMQVKLLGSLGLVQQQTLLTAVLKPLTTAC